MAFVTILDMSYVQEIHVFIQWQLFTVLLAEGGEGTVLWVCVPTCPIGQT